VGRWRAVTAVALNDRSQSSAVGALVSFGIWATPLKPRKEPMPERPGWAAPERAGWLIDGSVGVGAPSSGIKTFVTRAAAEVAVVRERRRLQSTPSAGPWILEVKPVGPNANWEDLTPR